MRRLNDDRLYFLNQYSFFVVHQFKPGLQQDCPQLLTLAWSNAFKELRLSQFDSPVPQAQFCQLVLNHHFAADTYHIFYIDLQGNKCQMLAGLAKTDQRNDIEDTEVLAAIQFQGFYLSKMPGRPARCELCNKYAK